MNKDEKYMDRCLQLASMGLCMAAPNPMVGAVIVYQDRIIGEGYHACCGKAHAEVNAIHSVKEKKWLSQSTLYVSLEPCSHYGKTPPCADLIIEKRIPRVVIGCQDPFSLVAGRGIAKLRAAGIDVQVGVREAECRQLIRRFITFHTHHRPYITLKWAESADGFIDIQRTQGTPFHLSSPLSGMLVHKRRAEHSAILVGRRTALLDNPSLTTRNWYGKNPVRLVIDKNLTLPHTLHLFDGKVDTLVFTEEEKTPNLPGVTYITLDFSRSILPQLLTVLYQKKLQSLLVEGGSILLQSFLEADLWDEAYVEKTPHRLHQGVAAPTHPLRYEHQTEKKFGREIKTFIHS